MSCWGIYNNDADIDILGHTLAMFQLFYQILLYYLTINTAITFKITNS